MQAQRALAAMRSTNMSVGSKSWIGDENAQVGQFCAQEIEDFTFSARNEVEWLNEHMADIFSKNQVNVTEIFKTPGKLRGKTPRTARKRNPLEAREPLTDVFSASHRPNDTPQHKVSPFKPSPTKTTVAFQVAEDPISPATTKKTTKANTDSGYHGLPEDDMEIDDIRNVPQSSAETNDTVEIFPKSPLQDQLAAAEITEGRDTTDRSLHPANTEIAGAPATENTEHEGPPAVQAEIEAEPSHEISIEQTAVAEDNALGDEALKDVMDLDITEKDLEEDLVADGSRSPSQGSSPARPLVRKSSLTFAALPAREPLTTKKSIGARMSRTSHLDQSKANLSRGSFLGRFTGGQSMGGSKQPEIAPEDEGMDVDVETEKPQLVREESDQDSKMTKLHNKSSTQRLHDRINMLGKSQPARPTKSIPMAAVVANPSYPELPVQEIQPQHLQYMAGVASEAVALHSKDEDDDDWIQPPQPQQDKATRPQVPKSISVDVMGEISGKQTFSNNDFGRVHNEERTAKQPTVTYQVNAHDLQAHTSARSKHVSVSPSTSPAKDDTHTRVELANVPKPSTTPIDSPSSKRYVDGPLSASKSRLQSIMKTARGLFSSSAGVSAQARMETLSDPSIGDPRGTQGPSIDEALDSKGLQKPKFSRNSVNNPVGRKTRSSTEKEEKRKEAEAKDRAGTEAENASICEDDRRFAAQQQSYVKDPVAEILQQPARLIRKSPRRTQNQDAQSVHTDVVEEDQPGISMGPPPSHGQRQQSLVPKSKEVRRPTRPAKEAAPKPKPQPVAIRVGTLSQGIRMNSATLSSSLQESLPPPQLKQVAVAKKPSNASLHTTASNSSLKGSVSSVTTKPKALLAAERKKEQDEKGAQRKIEQKREIERKRAALQEEARKQELLQRQNAERQRERERVVTIEDPKILAKKQAIEKRRMELKEQQRVPQRLGTENAPAAPQAQVASVSRQELGGPRPPSRLHNLPDHNRLANNQPVHNPMKPLNKRVFDPDADEESTRPSRPQGGTTYQQNDGKRRKTDDEEAQEVRVRPTMAPPIRQSGIRQGGLKPSFFNSNYTTAPPPAPQHHNGSSLLKTTTANQAYQQHAHQNQISRPGHYPDIAIYQNGKIPFADNPNPPHQSQPHKTPQARLAPQVAKSSPQYINGENIHLDDIPTDDEDESDSDPDSKPKPANLPEWAQSPNLRELLMTQDENMDADAVFGPVQSPHMEEMFRERHHRFRSRTSSANWAGADRLTDEEIRRDVEARQRLRREGGWTFGL